MYFKLYLYALLFFCGGSAWAADAAKVIFAAGDVTVAGRKALVGDLIQEGELLTTSKDGYLYLETIDGGFLILRPNSSGQIVTYRVDTANPAETRIKIELKNGVARHISGTAVKNARQNFRFNTPVAAIGVRGTDFTVFTDESTTRVAVISGGVVVSPLTTTCMSGEFGPCQGAFSRELFAQKAVQVLKVGRGQLPELLFGVDQAPDAVAPPRADEPSGTKPGARPLGPLPASGSDAVNPGLELLKISQLKNEPATANAAIQLVWGRWQAVLDKPIEIDVAALRANNQLIATNSYYALMRNSQSAWQAPLRSTMGFSLQQSQAVILDETSRQVSVAKIENGQLNIDFANVRFFTRFDLVNQSERFQLQNSGEVSSDGRLYGGSQHLRPNNMDVRGALANDNSTAAFLFSARLDDRRVGSGVAYWGK